MKKQTTTNSHMAQDLSILLYEEKEGRGQGDACREHKDRAKNIVANMHWSLEIYSFVLISSLCREECCEVSYSYTSSLSDRYQGGHRGEKEVVFGPKAACHTNSSFGGKQELSLVRASMCSLRSAGGVIQQALH